MLSPELIGKAVGDATRQQFLPPPALQALQEQKLRALLRVALEQSPFYQQLYRGLDVAHCPLTELPTVNKPLIQDHFDEVVTDRRVTKAGVDEFCRSLAAGGSPWYLGAYAVLRSSGTSGRYGVFVWDADMITDGIAMGVRQGGDSGPPDASREKQRIAAVMLQEGFDAAGLLMRMIPPDVAEVRFIDIRKPLPDICRELNDFQPSLLSSFPYILRLLCEEAGRCRLHITPTRITSSGDVLTPSDRLLIEETFEVAPLNFYCATEAPYIAWESGEPGGLYVNADYVIAESVDASSHPVPPGQLGHKMLLTNLSNRVLPLIRYEMADQIEYLPGPNPGKRQLPRIRTVAGRIEHMIRLPGASGKVALIPEYIDEYLGSLPGLVNYQIIQEAPARCTVNVVPRHGVDAGEALRQAQDGISRCFARYGVDAGAVQIDWHTVVELKPVREGATKVCQFWNRCSEA
jgi:phenylacetate-coenzyme A ligase PaaK-like adenylate-forming protein